MELLFNVTNQHIVRTDNNYVVADSQNYLTVDFTFSDDWVGTKTAVFTKGGTSYNVILDAEGRGMVPTEVIKQGRFFVSAFCGDLVTADCASVPVEASGYNPDSLEPGTPTPSVYSQLMSLLDKLRGGALGKFLKKKSNEDFDFEWVNGGGGGGGTDDYNDLDNKPSINGHELVGNQTAEDLGIVIPDIPDVPTVVQETGSSEEDVMSQKAVSDALSELSDSKVSIENLDGTTIYEDENGIIHSVGGSGSSTIESISLNGEALEIDENKNVDIVIAEHGGMVTFSNNIMHFINVEDGSGVSI